MLPPCLILFAQLKYDFLNKFLQRLHLWIRKTYLTLLVQVHKVINTLH